MQALINRYKPKGVLLDSNLLVLFFLGIADPGKIETFKRTKTFGFTEKEFLLLQEVLNGFSRVVVTPHILTETSNFICELYGETLARTLQVISAMVPNFKERCSEAKKLVATAEFLRFGLTDSAILDIQPKQYLVLSIDGALVNALQAKSIDAINFNHLRQQSWQS